MRGTRGVYNLGPALCHLLRPWGVGFGYGRSHEGWANVRPRSRLLQGHLNNSVAGRWQIALFLAAICNAPLASLRHP